MAAVKTQQSSSPFSRLSRFGAGLGLRSQPTPSYTHEPVNNQDDDWYIAYNGPYEMPKDTRKRDSWGDVVEEQGNGHGHDAILGDEELMRRYGGGGRENGGVDSNSGEYSRGRAQSTSSRFTASTGTIDPNRRSMRSPHRRQTFSKRAPVASYINLDAAGGVGDSPMPLQRSPVTPNSAPPSSGTNRTSLASFFFGGQSSSSRKSPRSPPRTNNNHSQGGSRAASPPRQSTSLDMPHSQPRSKDNGRVLAIQSRAPNDEEEYYNSYYSTLINTPKINKRNPHGKSREGASPSSSPERHKPTLHTHPYAYTFPARPAQAGSTSVSAAQPPPHPTSAPPVTRTITSPLLRTRHEGKDSPSSSSQQNHRERPHIVPPPSAWSPTGIHNVAAVANTLRPSPLGGLKSSVSTPNLRGSPRPQQSPVSPMLPRGVDKWLSAETWCDAMFLPRPRFKVKHHSPGFGENGSEKYSSGRSSGRIVSPPPTPISRSPNGGGSDQNGFPRGSEQHDPGPSSLRPRRRLTKSKSATSLKSKSSLSNLAAAAVVPLEGMPTAPPDLKGKSKLQKHRPKHLAMDDLALRPEPSLDRVLDEGDQLEAQRKEWQAHATSSFGNKQTRSLSRGRSKSLTQKGTKGHRKLKDGGKPMGSIDFLAARTLLGNQGVAPTIIVRTAPRDAPHVDMATEHRNGALSSKGHSHTNSNAHTTSHGHSNSLAHSNSQKSSQGQRGHGRQDSWGQSALKLAKSTASGAICGVQDGIVQEVLDEKSAAAEGAIMANGTKIVHLNDRPGSGEEEDFVMIDSKPLLSRVAGPMGPSLSSEGRAIGPNGSDGVSPAPSGATGNGVGIALSTPPGSDDHSQPTYESISIPDHPYAQGIHTTRPNKSTGEFGPFTSGKGSDFAGPHPSTPKATSIPLGGHDILHRHRLPPQASLPHMAHPYAMHSSPVDPTPQIMDAVNVIERQPRPTVERFGADGPRLVHAYARESTGNIEPLGVGEALSSLHRQGSRDTGMGAGAFQKLVKQTTPANREGADKDNNSDSWPLRVHRKPVAYAEDEEPSPSQVSSPEHLTPPNIRRNASSGTGGTSSGSSPQHSPRPLGNVDDLDHFHDLFYKPDQPTPGASSSVALGKGVRSGASNEAFPPWEVGSSQSVRSGLSSLARKLAEEYEDRRSLDQPPDLDPSQLAQGQRFGGLRGHRPSDIATSSDFIFSNLSKSNISQHPRSADSILPLHLGQEQMHPDDNVPEDIQSSRASSILERSSMDEDTFGFPLRFGAVEAVVTPPVVNDRTSGHFSLMADEFQTHSEHPIPTSEIVSKTLEHQNEEPQRITSQTSLSPPSAAADPSRSSYMTSTTEGSRMSGLSDFPVPPVQNLTPAHMSIIHSYFGGNTPQRQVEDPFSTNEAAPSNNRRHANFRMTFGGSEDMESISQAISKNPES